MLKIQKANLAALFARIAEKQDLYLPVKAAGKTNFAAWDENAQVDLDTLKTVKLRELIPDWWGKEAFSQGSNG